MSFRRISFLKNFSIAYKRYAGSNHAVQFLNITKYKFGFHYAGYSCRFIHMHKNSIVSRPPICKFDLYLTNSLFNSGHIKIVAVRDFSNEKPNIPSMLKESFSEEEEDKNKRIKSWKRMKLSLIVMGTSLVLFGSYFFYTLGSAERDENGNIIQDEFSGLPFIKQICYRFVHKLKYYTKVIQEPSAQKLLPDPLEYPYIQPPYTLVLELTDLLVHPDWTYKTGWRFKKRPNIDAFLEQVGPPLFEIVVFTAEQGITVFPILNQLDKRGLIAYRLVRDSTDFIGGHHVKNLDWLNRDLRRVIVVDWNPESVKLHPDNAFILPRWKGDDEDQTLLDLSVFLKAIVFNKVDDVRDVLRYYRQFENPIEAFRENQRKLQEQLEEQERIEQSKKEHPPLISRFTKSYRQS